MACSTAIALSDITYACGDRYNGGLKRVILANRSDVTYSIASDVLTLTSITAASAVEISFSNRDAFTNFTDVLTGNANGIVNVVPTIAVEVPKMDAAKRNALSAMAPGGEEIVAFLETDAGQYHCVGIDHGLYVSTINGSTGNSRSEKNTFQLTLTGLEDTLAYVLDATDWTTVTGALA